jgi:outer membrane protein
MRKLASVLLLAVALLTSSCKAQKQKTAYIRFDSVINSMPQEDTVKKLYIAYAQDLNNILVSYQRDFTGKYNDFQKNQATLKPFVKADKEKELNELNQHIEDYKKQAVQILQHYGDSLQNTVTVKAKIIINQVASDNDYTVVIDLSNGEILKYPEKDNILPIVLKRIK